jgi:hypothetical protein
MSIPDTDMHIGDLYEETLEKYSSGQLKKDGLIMLPEEALQYFINKAREEGFTDDMIENSAEELLYDLEDVEENKYKQYLEVISIDKLVDIYNKYKENLQPLSSADEEMRKDNITNKQRDWLIKFIRLWDLTEQKER